MSYSLLQQAPKDQGSPEFLDFLRVKNKVVWEDNNWLVIENCKYHKPPKVMWYTAFSKSNRDPVYDLYSMMWDFMDWEWLKKSTSDQTVPGRFHIHLIKRHLTSKKKRV